MEDTWIHVCGNTTLAQELGRALCKDAENIWKKKAYWQWQIHIIKIPANGLRFFISIILKWRENARPYVGMTFWARLIIIGTVLGIRAE